MRRVVHVVNDLSNFFSHRRSLVDFLKSDFEVIILAPDHLDFSQLIENGYDVRPYRLSRKGLNPLNELRSLLSLIQSYRSLKPDIVHHFTIKPVLYGSIAARIAKAPKIINTITGLGYVFTGDGLIPKILKPLVMGLYRLTLKSPDTQVIFQNNDDYQLFKKNGLIDNSRSMVIPGSGVDTDRFLPTEEPLSPPIRVVLPARMLWDKGIKEFVEAARVVRQQNSDIEFELVGGLDSDNRMAIPENDLRQWEKEGLVKWKGKSSDMPAAYRDCHIVCLPSYREGLPMALLEAASCGRAIITTDAPGCRDVIQDGKSGVMIPVGDYSALATAILATGQNKALRAVLGANARIYAIKEASKNVVNSKIVTLYIN